MGQAESRAMEAQEVKEEEPMPTMGCLLAPSKAGLTSVIPIDQAICHERERKGRGRGRERGRKEARGVAEKGKEGRGEEVKEREENP